MSFVTVAGGFRHMIGSTVSQVLVCWLWHAVHLGMKKTVLILLLQFSLLSLVAQNKISLLFTDDFTKQDTGNWDSEITPLPDSNVYYKDGNLFPDTKGGVTVWYKKCSSTKTQYYILLLLK